LQDVGFKIAAKNSQKNTIFVSERSYSEVYGSKPHRGSYYYLQHLITIFNI